MLPFIGRNRVTSTYGYRTLNGKRNYHGGIDIVGDDDRTVHCVVSGKVSLVSKWDGHSKTGTQSYGNLVVVQGNDGNRHYYAHLESFAVSLGQTVNAGDKIGVMGATGNVTGPHLHYEVRTGKTTSTRVNPADLIDLDNAKGTYTAKDEKIDVKYQVYSQGRWLPWVENLEDYAGNRWHSISGLRIGVSKGHVIYQVHTQKNGWLPWVTDYNETDSNGYAGVLGHPIDMVRIGLLNDENNAVEYSVSPVGRKFYGTVTDYNETDKNGYAGAPKRHIDRIQIKIVRK